MKTNNSNHADSNSRNEVNSKKQLFILLQKWYWLLLLLLIAVGVAYLFNQFVPKEYKMEAHIIFKRDSRQYDARMNEALQNLDLLGNIKELDQESDIQLLQSHQLIRDALEKLNFEVSYYKKGKLFDRELYQSLPFYIQLEPSKPLYAQPVDIEMLSGDQYKVTLNGDDPSQHVVSYGEEFSQNGIHFTLYKKEDGQHAISKGDRYYFQAHRMDDLIKHYQEDKLEVTRLKEESDIISISSTGPVPEKEKDFINTLIESFKEHQFKRIDQNANASIQFINHHVNKIDNRLLELENELQGLEISRSRIMAYNNRGSMRYVQDQDQYGSSSLYDRLSSLEEQKMELEDTKADYQYLSGHIETNHNIDSVFLPVTDNIADAGINQLLQELVTLQNELNTSRQNIQDDHPYYQSVEQQYQELKKTLLTKVNLFIDHLDKSMAKLDKKMAEIKLKIPTVPFKERHYRELLRKIKQNEDVLDILSEKKIEFELIKASKAPNYYLLKEPRLAEATQTFPNPLLNYSLAFLLGFILPSMITIYQKNLSPKIEDKEEIVNNSSIPILHALETNPFKTQLPVYYHPQSAITDGFRHVRAKILYRIKSEQQRVIMVTSMVSGEGKSFISANLAISFAMSGKKTLIINADIRKPSLDKIFSVKEKKGLSDYFANKSGYKELIQPLPMENLYILPHGKSSSNTGDLFSEDKIKALLDHLSNEFDFILFDSPPFSIVPESTLIAEQCHCNIFVIRHDYSPKKILDSLEEIKNEGRVKNMLLMVNGVKKLKRFGFEYYHGYDYSYGFGHYKDYYNASNHRNKHLAQHKKVVQYTNKKSSK